MDRETARVRRSGKDYLFLKSVRSLDTTLSNLDSHGQRIPTSQHQSTSGYVSDFSGPLSTLSRTPSAYLTPINIALDLIQAGDMEDHVEFDAAEAGRLGLTPGQTVAITPTDTGT